MLLATVNPPENGITEPTAFYVWGKKKKTRQQEDADYKALTDKFKIL